MAVAALRFLHNHSSLRIVLGKSYSDPQEGLSVYGVLLLANSEVRVRAASAETPAVATMNTKMISILWLCLRFCFLYLESQSQRILDRDPPSLVLSAF